MKKHTLLYLKSMALTLLISTAAVGQIKTELPTGSNNESCFYYGSNMKKVYLKMNTKYAYVSSEDRAVLEQLDLNGEATLDKIREDHANVEKTVFFGKLEFKNHLSDEAYLKFVHELKQHQQLYVAPYFITTKDSCLGLSQYIEVKLKNADDLPKLRAISEQYGLSILPKRAYSSALWYVLSCKPGDHKNAIEAANIIAETGLFAAVAPDLMVKYKLHCSTNDPLFNQQWGLQNTGQNGGTPGVDINICDAWNITTGSSGIKIAVVDEGVQMDHPDLSSNIYGTGYDAITYGPSLVWGDHATACAGIIGAIRNNTIGTSGVAPGCKLMSASTNFLDGDWTIRRQRLADCIKWAYQNGADVISNSWGNDNLDAVSSPITDEIHDAVTLGRGGKGTVVVFSVGNANQNITYPGTLDDVIAVGALSPCGERKNLSSCDGETEWDGSNYGPQLDIMAPGVFIPTTDRTGGDGYTTTNYMPNFNMTSSAAPHVAAVAGLMLSVNPCMTQAAVRETLENSARKTGNYTYSATAGYNSGTWNNEMGYGALDAHKAVKAAQEQYSPFLDLYMKDVPEDYGAEPATYSANTPLWVSGDIWTRNSPDGIEVHQNVAYDNNSSNPTSYVYVRIRNKSCAPSLGTEKVYVYFAKAGSYANWPVPWTNTSGTPRWGGEIGMAAIPVIPAGGEVIIPVTWNDLPNPQDYTNSYPVKFKERIYHFCLLARIVADDDPMHSELTGNSAENVISHNVMYNNNVAMKNISIINYDGPGPLFPFLVDHSSVTVGNLTTVLQKYKLRFHIPETETGNQIIQEAEVKVILDETVWDIWQNGGAVSSGLRVLNSTNHELLITGSDAFLSNLIFTPGQLGDISVQFNFLTETSTGKTEFTYDMVQEDLLSGSVINGNRFQIHKPLRSDLFQSQGGNWGNNNAILTAMPINEPATYRWYTADTLLVDTGISVIISNSQAQPALLEVTAQSDGFKDYAALPGSYNNSLATTDSIALINPNPTSNQATTVHYYLSGTTQSAALKVTAINNPAVMQTYTLNISQSQHNLNLALLPPGVYLVSLHCNGQLKHTRQLLIQ